MSGLFGSKDPPPPPQPLPAAPIVPSDPAQKGMQDKAAQEAMRRAAASSTILSDTAPAASPTGSDPYSSKTLG